jgi:hypothetical protein
VRKALRAVSRLASGADSVAAVKDTEASTGAGAGTAMGFATVRRGRARARRESFILAIAVDEENKAREKGLLINLTGDLAK